MKEWERARTDDMFRNELMYKVLKGFNLAGAMSAYVSFTRSMVLGRCQHQIRSTI